MPFRSDRRQFLAASGLSLLSATGHSASPAMDKIRVGQIGVGHAHASKLSVYRASPDYEVVGIVEPDQKLRRVVRSPSRFIAEPPLDVPRTIVEHARPFCSAGGNACAR